MLPLPNIFGMSSCGIPLPLSYIMINSSYNSKMHKNKIKDLQVCIHILTVLDYRIFNYIYIWLSLHINMAVTNP